MPLRRLSLVLFALVLLVPCRPAAAAPSRPATGSGPALAVEDTMHTEVPPVLVSAPRVTLDEILDRVARGEAHRDSLVRDQSYVLTVRAVGHVGEDRPAQLLEETVSQVWQRPPSRQTRTLELRHWEAHSSKDDKRDVQVEFSGGTGEDIVNFAFQPSARREFRYTIAGRELRGDHLVYRLAFEPRSPLALGLPGGQVWVDTKDYVIVRQEITFRESPVPLFLRGIHRMVVERQRVGELWALSRVLVRVETTLPIPRYGRHFDLAIDYTQFAINTGLPDSLFAGAGGRKKGGAR